MTSNPSDMAFEPLLKSEEQIKRAILRNTTQQRCGLEGWFFTESKGFRQLNSSVVGKFFFFRTSPGSNLRKANVGAKGDDSRTLCNRKKTWMESESSQRQSTGDICTSSNRYPVAIQSKVQTRANFSLFPRL